MKVSLQLLLYRMVTTKAITKQSKNPKPSGKKASASIHSSPIQIQLFVVLFKVPMFIYVYYINYRKKQHRQVKYMLM